MKSGRAPIRRTHVALGMSLLLLAGAMSAVSAAGAAGRATTSIDVRPLEDTYVSSAHADGTYHRDSTLRMSAQNGDAKQAYLKFAVSNIPKGAVVKSAKLVLRRDDHHFPSTTVRASSVHASWTARSLTAKSAPDAGPVVASVTVDRSEDAMTLDLKRAVARNATYGFSLSSATTDDVVRVRSSEAGKNGPLLRIAFIPPSAPPSAPPKPIVGGPPAVQEPAVPSDDGLSDVWIGAAANTPTSSDLSVFDAATAKLGPMTYRRSFDQSLPSTFQQSAAAGDAREGYRSFVSWKPPGKDFVGAASGKYDAQIIRWAKSVPSNGVYATAYHEPENDMTGAQFVAMQRHLYSVVKKANPKIRWGSVYMAYWWEQGTSHYIGNPDVWFPGREYVDFVGLDIYALDKPTPLAKNPRFTHWYSYMSAHDVPIVLAEYGQYGVQNGQRNAAAEAERAKVIEQDARWIASRDNIEMWLYWHAMGKKNDDWRIQDAASQDAWTEVAKAGRKN